MITFHWIYFILLFYILYFAYKQVNNNKKYNTQFRIIGFVLICSAGFRFFTGADYIPYLNIFRFAISIPFLTSNIFGAIVEPTLIWICQINNYLGLEFVGVTLTYSIIAIFLKFNTIKKYSPYTFISILVYFCFYYFFQEYGHIRQGVAVAICFFSIRYIYERKLLYFLLFLFLAYSFHRSSIFFIMAYFLAPLKISTRMAVIIIIVSILLIPFEIHDYFNLFTPLMQDDSLDEMVNIYSDDNRYRDFSDFSIRADFFKLVQLLIIFSYDKVANNTSKLYSYVRNLTIFGFAFSFAFRANEIFSTRLTVYYFVFIVLTYPLLISQLNNFQRKRIRNIVLIIMFVFFIRLGLNAKKYNFDNFDNLLFNSSKFIVK